ncbi:hypothetical protein N7456_000573 [Penicillium angulare]|uniref:Uncharacterized protein n=1 Tax=Penicillium angulare TaxID=116970 RepID=A0A9W9KS90_9EURO|nr:hypothetical protein N7456_000573 [Penicillium angulare]
MVQNETPPSYQSIFMLGSEIPRFMLGYRLWEDEAFAVLWAFNIPEISQVIRYGLFRDVTFPRNSLLSRNADTIEAFLMTLSEPVEHQSLMTLSHVQKVEEILRRSSIPPFREVPWSWFPPLPGHSLDARSIAADIETESHFHFCKIEFEEIVRASLDYNAPSVEWFLLQHTALSIHLMDHLQAYPEEIPVYLEVEKHLRSRSPFARRALVHCLQTIVPETAATIPDSKLAGFQFIAGPIQSLFMDQPPGLTTILKVFSVLAVRFRRQYIHSSRMDWYTPFDITNSFLEDCRNSTSAKDLARVLTSADEVDFAPLTRQSITTGDVMTKRIATNWNNLSLAVWECCTAIPDLTTYLRDCTQASLQNATFRDNKKEIPISNPIVDGLHKYAITTARSRGLNSTVGGMVVLEPLLPPVAVFLTNPNHNYASYRQYYGQYPGIPFLLPYIREFQQQGESGIQPLLDYIQDPFAAKG